MRFKRELNKTLLTEFDRVEPKVSLCLSYEVDVICNGANKGPEKSGAIHNLQCKPNL